jgi:rfaE bifunctional protein kinase chain/domain
MELKEILSNFKNKEILVIGDIMLDKYTVGTVKRISPEAPVPVLNVEKEYFRAGGAGNVALNVSNLSPENKIHFFSFLGNDIWAEKLEGILNLNNLSCYFEKTEYDTIIKERIMGRSSGPEQHIIRIDREENSKKIFQSKLEKLSEIAEKSDIIIVSDYAKGTITSELMKVLEPYKSKIVIDPKPTNKNFEEIYKNSYIITPSRAEAFVMAGTDDVDEAGKILREKLNSNILITLGKKGMKLFAVDGESEYIETIPEDSFEETGAGDTAISALALALSSKKDSIPDILNAAKLGNYAAGITIKKIGAYAPNFNELEDKINNLYKNE